MKIIELMRKDELIDPRSDIHSLEEVLIVEMTQEEYMLSCHAVIEAQKQQSTKK